MPQLAVETFFSQVFWVLLGFFAVYAFVSNVVTGGIESIFKSRSSYVDDLTSNTEQINTEVENLENASAIALENSEIASAAKESELIASFREQSIVEKDKLYNDFSTKSKLASAELSKAAETLFAEMSFEIEIFVAAAINSMNRSSEKNNKRNLQ